MSKKFRLLMVLVLVTGLIGGLMTASTVSADPTPGDIIEIPRIDVGDVFGTGAWDTKIQIQNVDAVNTTVTATFYGGNWEDCPPNEVGAIGTAEMWVPINGVWTLHNAIPSGAESAIITTAPEAELAVTVDRWGPDATAGTYELASSYTGITDPEMWGPGPPYKYFAPYIMHGYNDLDTTLTIQNSGDICASVQVEYKAQGESLATVRQHVEGIAPGEAIRIGPGDDADVAFPTPELDAPWLGSAYVTANAPLAIMVDQLSLTGDNRAVLSSFRGMPYKKHAVGEEWDTKWYADLLYREISGWDSSIQVQNLTQESLPTFVTVDFMDQSGDEILFVGDWVPATGGTTFYLPAITDLGVNFPFGYVGAAEIASLQQVDYPGELHEEGEPIFTVVDIKKRKVYDETLPGWRHTVAGENQAGAYNAHPYQEKENATGWAMPFIAKEGNGVTSRIALRNNSNCNKFYGKIWIMDETGVEVGVIHTPWLHRKHLKIFDLAYQGFLTDGFVGAARFEVLGVEQLCDTDADGLTDQEPVMPSVVVLNYGFEKELPIGGGAGPQTTEGDLTRVYEAIPYVTEPRTCVGDILGKVHSIDPCEDPAVDAAEPIEDVSVSITDMYTVTTNSTGDYEMEDVEAGTDLPVEFAKTAFLTYTEPMTLTCGEDEVLDAELLCLGDVGVKVVASVLTDTKTVIVPGASVEYSKPYPDKADHYGDYYETSGTTDNTGVLTLTVPVLNATGTFTVTASDVAEAGNFDWSQMGGDPDTVGANSITAGTAKNTKILSGTVGLATDEDSGENMWDATVTGDWYGFDDASCKNIGGLYVELDNQDVGELVLCGLGTIAGRVTAGGQGKVGELVKVIQDGEVVGSDTTDANGSYVIQGIPTECFSATDCADFDVVVASWVEQGTWNGCGDIERVDFAF